MEPLGDLAGECAAIVSLRGAIKDFLRRQSNARRFPSVLIQGETGTGKGLLAHALHDGSSRAAEPFVDVNCAAIPENLLESEMFGYEKGAFTDARASKAGLFESADGGTLFLDETALLPAKLQSKLLNVLEAGAVRRLGSTRSVPVNVWIIAATNADLGEAVRAREFREDLFHRLAVMTFALPPLRERGRDVPLLAGRFVATFCAEYGLPAKTLSAGALTALGAYDWPGNVRELRNVIERAVLLSDSVVITADMLQLSRSLPRARPREIPLETNVEDMLRVQLGEALARTSWNISRTAALLGLTRNTVRARIERFGLRPAGSEARSPARGPASPIHGEAEPAANRPESTAPDAAAPVSLRRDRRRIALLRIALAAPGADGAAVLEANELLKLALEKVQSFGGTIESLSLDGLEAAFGLEPVEDPPRRAAHAGLAIYRELVKARPAGRRPMARITIHTGEMDVFYAGELKRLEGHAQRRVAPLMESLMAAAAPGLIVVSAATVPFLRRWFVLAPAGRAAIGVDLYSVVGHEAFVATGERATRFVGRQRELDLLGARLASARTGQGQLVAVVGDAGVGKSRLVWELAHGADGSAVRLLETGSAYGAVAPYLPVIELLRRYFAIATEDDGEVIRQRVTAALANGDPRQAPSRPALLALLGAPEAGWAEVDPDERRHLTREAVKQVLLDESRLRPVLLVFEDVHWIDAESAGLLEGLVEALPTARMLLIVTYRREHRHEWTNLTYYTQLNLGPLAVESATALLDDLLGSDPSLDPVKRHLSGWTDGNPFFLEECVQSLIETGAVEGTRGTYRAVRASVAVEVPPTVEDILATRIERLAASEKALVQTAAAIGAEVPLGVLSSVVARSDEFLRSAMRRLQAAELLQENSATRGGGFVFKHALTREVAYRSLLPEVRRDLHRRIVTAMEEAMPADGSPELLDRLARHAVQGELWSKAATYLRTAGDRSMGAAAAPHAAEYFQQALQALEQLPESRERLEAEVDLRLRLRDALWPQLRLPAIADDLARADLTAGRLQDRRRQGWIAAYLCHYLWSVGDLEQARPAGERALTIGREIGDAALVAETEFYRGLVQLSVGDLAQAVAILAGNVRGLDDAIAQADTRFPSPRFVLLGPVYVRGYLSSALSQLGEFGRAIAVAEEGMALAEASRSPFALVVASGALGGVHVRKGDAEAAVSVLQPGLRLCRTYGVQPWAPPIGAALGAAYTQLGRVDEGIALLEESVALADRLGLAAHAAVWVTLLGEAYRAAGRWPHAVSVARRALALCRERKERGFEASALRLVAELATLGPAPDYEQARTAYEGALARARECGMRPLIARCQLGLARVCERTGQPAQAEALLATASATFSALEMAGLGE